MRVYGDRKGLARVAVRCVVDGISVVGRGRRVDCGACIGRVGACIARELAFSHERPIYKAVDVQREEGDKANDHGQVCEAARARHNPHDDEHNIVKRVRQPVKATAPRGEVRRDKRGKHGKRAHGEVCGVERAQNKVERDCHRDGGGKKNQPFAQGEGVYLDLAAIALVRVFEPQDERDDCHGQAHAEVGYHFAVVRKRVRDYAVKHAEHDGEDLPDGIALGHERQRGHADDRAD